MGKEEGHGGERGIEISLYRNEELWSGLHAGVYVAEEYNVLSVSAECMGKPGQVTEARKAMDVLVSWPEVDDERENEIAHNLSELGIVEGVLKFARSEFERQIELQQVHPSE